MDSVTTSFTHPNENTAKEKEISANDRVNTLISKLTEKFIKQEKEKS